MIPDETEGDVTINFYWFYFIGTAKLGLSLKETGRLTITTFNKLYDQYKDNFDLELMLRNTQTTYRAAEQKAMSADEWF